MEEENTKDGSQAAKRNFFKKKGLMILLLLILVGTVTAAASLKASEKPSFCASCHIIKPHYQSWESGPLLAAKHGNKDVKCLDCHSRTLPEKMEEGFKYVTGQYQDPLKEGEFSKQECLKCHQKDQQKMIEATNFDHGNPHDSHLGDVDCNLCHKMHRQSEVYCVQCHDFEWFKKLDKGGWNIPAQ